MFSLCMSDVVKYSFSHLTSTPPFHPCQIPLLFLQQFADTQPSITFGIMSACSIVFTKIQKHYPAFWVDDIGRLTCSWQECGDTDIHCSPANVAIAADRPCAVARRFKTGKGEAETDTEPIAGTTRNEEFHRAVFLLWIAYLYLC